LLPDARPERLRCNGCKYLVGLSAQEGLRRKCRPISPRLQSAGGEYPVLDCTCSGSAVIHPQFIQRKMNTRGTKTSREPGTRLRPPVKIGQIRRCCQESGGQVSHYTTFVILFIVFQTSIPHSRAGSINRIELVVNK
jgi:hypothetical protein